MLPRSINVGPLTIHLYGLIIGIAIFAGWLLAKKRANLYKIPQKIFDDWVLIIPLVLGIVGARLYHVADYWKVYSHDLLSILYINRGGLGIWGGLVAALLGFFIIAKIKKLDLLSVLDLSAPSLLLGQALGRFGNFINQEGFGPPTNLPWGVFVQPLNRPAKYSQFSQFHPTFFYEAALDGIFLFVLLYFAKRFKIRGQIFAFYLIFYSTGRFIVEFWRIDTWTVGEIKVAHILAVLTFLVGIGLFGAKRGLDPA